MSADDTCDGETAGEPVDHDEIFDADDSGLGPVLPCWYAGHDPGRIWPEPAREPFRWPSASIKESGGSQ